MKLIYEFEFLEKDCPLVSRELVRPWRLAALAVGLGILIAGSHLTPSADWDYPICFVMGLWAYVFAPWTVRAMVYLDWNSVGTLPNDSVISPESPHLSLFIYATFLALFARR
jgi:hypothetical protein